MRISAFFFVFLSTFALADYPTDWWKEVPADQKKSWETLPQEAGPNEVVLSKRTELGIFSNLSKARFYYDGKVYASVEGLWQMLKYPETQDKTDPRHAFNYPFKRKEVGRMWGFDCKKAGDMANQIMREEGISWVSYQGKRFDYKDLQEGSEYHYQLIKGAIEAKVLQNPPIKKLLLRTKGLKLIPDHSIKSSRPKSYFYHQILMDLRQKLLKE